MGITPGSLDIGGEKIFGLEIPKIPIAAGIKNFLIGPPGTGGLKDELSSTVRQGVMEPILIGSLILGLIIAVAITVKGK